MIAYLSVKSTYGSDIALIGEERGGGSCVMVELKGGKVRPEVAINPSSFYHKLLLFRSSCTLLMYFLGGSLFSFLFPPP